MKTLTPKFFFLIFCFSICQFLSARNYFPVASTRDDSVFYNNQNKIIRFNFITGMFYSPHIDFAKRYSKHWGWGMSVLIRPGLDRAFYRFCDNPDVQLAGFGIFGDFSYYLPNYFSSKPRYWTFTLRGGYRDLSKQKFSVGYETSAYLWCYLTRVRQDIVSDFRISYVMPLTESHVVFDLFASIGARVSIYKTEFFSIDSPNHQLGTDTRVYTNANGFPANGCYVLPEYNAGVEIGFGW